MPNIKGKIANANTIAPYEWALKKFCMSKRKHWAPQRPLDPQLVTHSLCTHYQFYTGTEMTGGLTKEGRKKCKSCVFSKRDDFKKWPYKPGGRPKECPFSVIIMMMFKNWKEMPCFVAA